MGNSCDKVKHFKDQNFSKLQSECRRRGELFEDPQFEISSAVLAQGSDGNWARSEVRWLRPGQICQGNNEKPEFQVGNLDR